ncbi:MAG: DEAD/DEAH box helicase [Lactobacillales bacterium]|jgi:SNF2 family DNA or RNA helicase|nr:DEAD/DEAH box helicase [Lactobacillales bacterium]
MKWTTPKKVIDEARELIAEGNVYYIRADIPLKGFVAEVYDTRVNHVFLDGTPVEDDNCDCETFKTRGYCRHMIAAELVIRNEKKSRIIRDNPDLEYGMPYNLRLIADAEAESEHEIEASEHGNYDDILERIIDPNDLVPEFHVNLGNEYLEVNFDIKGINYENVNSVLESILKGEKFHIFSDGKILVLDQKYYEEMNETLQFLRDELRPTNEKIIVEKSKIFELSSAIKQIHNVDYEQDERFEQLLDELAHPFEQDFALPKGLAVELRPYQAEGFKWLKTLSRNNLGGILADEMGLGKTLQVLTYLLSEKEELLGKFKRSLVVAPASLIYNWEEEIAKFTPGLKAVVVSGTKEQRMALLDAAAETDIVITSYASLRQDIEEYKKEKFEYFIIDEAHNLKNDLAKTTRALSTLRIKHRFALSGTPIENHVGELWSIVRIILPGLFPAKKLFRTFEHEKISKMIQPFILRRDKTTVALDIPDKVEVNLYTDLYDEQKEYYLATLEAMKRDFGDMEEVPWAQVQMHVLSGILKLRQICCDPKLIDPEYSGSSAKLEQLKDLIGMMKENDSRVIIFSQFTSMLNIIAEDLEKMGLSYYYLSGSTPISSRLEMVDNFNEGKKDIFLISLKAGGTGLNITGANTVILYDIWWNPNVEEQAFARAHRIGQTKTVEIIRLIAKDSIEEKILRLQNDKRQVFSDIISGQSVKPRLTKEDIKEILGF